MKIMKTNRKILIFSQLVLLVTIMLLIANKVILLFTEQITRFIVVICFLLYVFTLGKLDDTKTVIIGIILLCAIFAVNYRIADHNEITYIKEENYVTYGIVTDIINRYKSPDAIKYSYYVNDTAYKAQADIPLIPAKGYFFPRFKNKYEFSIGDTILVRYSIEKPEISRVSKFKPTTKEIGKYKVQDTTKTISDTATVIDTIIKENEKEKAEKKEWTSEW